MGETTVFTPCLEAMENVRNNDGSILSKPFLDMCRNILPVLDKFGTAMGVVKIDINGNITRLEKKYDSDHSKYHLLYSIVEEEVESKTTKRSSSNTNGLLWLTRAMDYLIELFGNLVEHPDWSMSHVCTHSYAKTLKQWHGFLASSSFTIAMKLAPDRKKFMQVIGGESEKLIADIQAFHALFSPFLQENHKVLVNYGVDNLKAS
ncbi:putative Glycolipid transfer protein [Zostera marina]|uniref:Putative Glycolipid transfer protein n=1 Tax=Zostera marina TaxID=29655 RepID=A0A0K9Q0Y7_ZOSMR|nr:putative Glycolipid transfer protein [Zostera marina]